MAMGVPADPDVGRILRTLLEEVQDEILENSEEALAARARELA